MIDAGSRRRESLGTLAGWCSRPWPSTWAILVSAIVGAGAVIDTVSAGATVAVSRAAFEVVAVAAVMIAAGADVDVVAARLAVPP